MFATRLPIIYPYRERSATKNAAAKETAARLPRGRTATRAPRRERSSQQCTATTTAHRGRGDFMTAPTEFRLKTVPGFGTIARAIIALVRYGPGLFSQQKFLVLLFHIERCDTRSEERRVGKECRSRW